jgi:hypothetical protein
MSYVIRLLALSFALLTQATPTGVSGRWEGAIDISGTKIPLVAVFTESASGVSATMDIQGAKALPLKAVSHTGAKVHFELPAGLGLAVFDGAVDGDKMTGTFTQGPGVGTFTIYRGGVPVEKPGPPPPYHEEAVTFTNGTITLAGTLTIPEGTGPFPAFVMVTGSGLQNRDEEIFGFKIFRVIADYMTRRGIATLRYDDRGAGGSTGSIATATTEDFAGDALAGVALLASRAEIDRTRIGVFGHSEGADVAAIAAAKSPGSVGFIIMMAGAAVSGATVLHQQTEDGARQVGATDDQVARILAAHQHVMDAIATNASAAARSDAVRELITAQLDGRPAAARAANGDTATVVNQMLPQALAQMNSPWMRYFVTMDPATFITRVRCPAYAAFGAKDTQVPPALHKGPLEAAFAKGGNTRVTVKVYPDANHLFIKANTGQVSEYATLDKTFVPGFLDDLAT